MAFQGYLREDTAAVIPLGSYVDKGDGVTYEVGLATAMNHADTGVRISKNGGALAARTTATEPSYDAFGYYLVDLDATDIGTPGRLKVIYGVPATALPCEADFVIIPATLWDTLFVVQPCAAINKFFDKASPTGTVNSLADAVPGAAGGGFIAGTNAATTITTALTAAIIGNITGNLSGSIGSYTGNTPQTADNNTLLTAIAGYLDTEIAAIVAAVITNAAGTDVAADIIALKAVADAIPTAAAIRTAIEAAGSHLTLIKAQADDLADGERLDLIFDAIKAATDLISAVSACGDGDSPVADSLAEVLRQDKWFVANKWDVDENQTPDTLTMFKDDGSTPGLSFQVYTDSSHNYRLPV